jgi:hypothetical protein
MDIEILSWLQTIEAGIGLLPSAIIAAVLLGGPTAGWLLYRFVVQPRTSRYRAVDNGAIMWVCGSCRSVNELRADRCYRCDREPDEADLHVIDPNLGMPIPMNLPIPTAMTGVPVGPGRNDLATVPGLTRLTGIRGVTASETRPPATDDREHIAVGPGRPRAARPRRAVVAGRPRAVATDPDDPSAA